MVSSQKELCTIKVHFISDALDKISEISWCHPCIPAILVTLVGCTFNQGTGIVFFSSFQYSFNDLLICAAARINSYSLTVFLNSNNFL